MAQRLDLHALFKALLGSDNVYFQPPSNVQMKYPCIVYERDGVDTRHADNSDYTRKWEYSVTYIDRNPDSPMVETLADLPLCGFDRSFPSDDLYHNVFTLYF